MHRFHRHFVASATLAAISIASGQVKQTLKPTDYGQWQSMTGSTISDDGRWFGYGIQLVDGDGWTEIRNVDGPEKAQIPLGYPGMFSDDSKWFACLVGVAKKEADKLRLDHKPIPTSLALRNLASGAEIRLEGVRSFQFLKGSKFMIANRARLDGNAAAPSELYVLNLADGTSVTLGNVAVFALNKSETLIAAGVEGTAGEKGLQLFDPATSTLKTIRWTKHDYADLTWAESTDTLGFLEGTKSEAKDGDWFTAFEATDLGSPHPVLKSFAAEVGKGLPAGTRIAEFGGLNLNRDGSVVSFGIRKWDDKKKPDANAPEKAGVDVWNGKDLRIQPLQQRQAEMDLHRTALCVWRPATGAFLQLSDEKMRDVVPMKGFANAIGIDETPYQTYVTNGFGYMDVYAIDTATGTRKRIATKTHNGPIPSREGRYVALYQGKNWSVYDFSSGTTAIATQGMGSRFEDAEDDHTAPEKPPVGNPIWLAKDAGAVFSDKFDSYLWTPGRASLQKLNGGNDRDLVYRLIDTRASEDGISIDRPMYFSLFDPILKRAGFYRRDVDGTGKTLILDDRSMGGLTQAKKADRMTFIMGSFEDSPNAYVTNGLFSQAKPITKTNPQQAKYLWGHTQLIQYKSRKGDALQGELIYPADYQKGKKYPMVVYIYEKLSDSLHRYIAPSDTSAYNPQAFSQNGYFVLMPDIVYHGRQPGLSAVDSIEPAVAEALKLGDVDATKVGLVGHSWGAYQTAFLSTKSKMFKAFVAGAPLTDLISMYGSIYWNSGTPDQEILETSQGRLEVPYWDDLKNYIENSPVFNVKGNQAPLLITFGTADGAVDWHQGQEMYIAMRRLGKDVVLLVYDGENHGLAKKANQLDYAHKVRHFFDVYLKGVAPEKWLKEGVPFIEKG